jgi:hypothetical protein
MAAKTRLQESQTTDNKRKAKEQGPSNDSENEFAPNSFNWTAKQGDADALLGRLSADSVASSNDHTPVSPSMQYCKDATAAVQEVREVVADKSANQNEGGENEDNDWIDMIEQECGTGPAQYVNLLKNPERFTGKFGEILLVSLNYYCCDFTVYFMARILWTIGLACLGSGNYSF